MNRILFTAATSGELKIVKQEVKKNKLKNINVDFLLLGMGNYSTIMNLQYRLFNNKYDFIVNVGVCGYNQIYKGNIQIGRIKNLSNNKELIVPSFIKITDLESIACSEKIVYSSDKIGEETFVDMESYGVELVCDKYEIPRIILKIPVDKIGEETKNFNFEKAKKSLEENIDYSELLKKISIFLKQQENIYNKNNILVNQDIELINKIYLFYKMSVTEKILFKKLYNKYKVLVEDDGGVTFKDFFEKNRIFSKKEFMNILK